MSGGPHIVDDHLPHFFVADAAVVKLNRVKQLGFREHIDDIDIDAGCGAAEIEEMRGIGGEADQFALMENRYNHPEVGCMRRPVIGVVVDDDVALVDLALEALEHAADVERQRADVHRRAFALAKLVAVHIEDATAQILGFANDAGIRHAVEDVRHLLGDCVEGTTDNPQGYRIQVIVGEVGDNLFAG